MPANLTPEYKAAEAAFRKARDARERLDCLREMLRSIPKHKGTDHLQADIKTRIKQLTEELAGPRKGGMRGGPPTVIRPEGAAQIALLGAPNAGKSALHGSLTGSGAPVGPYPFTTQHPLPGMMPFEDIHFQLIDLPPVSPLHPVPWIANTLQPADGCLLVVDLGDPECLEQVLSARDILAEKRVFLSGRWVSDAEMPEPAAGVRQDPFAIRLATLMIATKVDRISAFAEELGVFRELSGLDFPALPVSVDTGDGLSLIGPWLFRALGVVRVYTKVPGKPTDSNKPFTVRRGDTVQDVAERVHKDVARSLRYARVWGAGHFQGQQVGRDHPVCDGDVLELHV
jgi:ribosome-interacting GTPase 1